MNGSGWFKRLLVGILFTLFLALPDFAGAWEGHRWDAWLSVSREKKPDIQSPQSGRGDLLPLMQRVDNAAAPIDTIEEWEKKRDSILAVLQKILGEPEDIQSVPPYAEILSEEDRETYWRRHIRIACEADDWIPAFLLIPKPFPIRPNPATIVLHQTVAQGKKEVCGIEGDPEQALAVELVNQGFVCIAPDAIGFGERIPPGASPYHDSLKFFQRYSHWSYMGKMVWDVQRIVDYLETLPFIDPARIGCIGHSHGAYGTIFATIFEPRISAAIASCGFTPLRFDPTPERWSHLTPLIPRLGFYLPQIAGAPFDWHEILACLAPRSFFNWAVLDDDIFPNTHRLRAIYESLKSVYGLYGAEGKLQARLEPGEHSFPASVRQESYHWLNKHLPLRPDLESIRWSPLTTVPAWETSRQEIQALLLRDIGSIDPPQLEPQFEILETHSREGYIEKKIRYLAASDEPVTAYWLTPDLPSVANQFPVVIVFHQTTPEGKEEAAGHAGRASIQFGPELARRGYIVLAPDSIAAGERIGPAGAFDTRDVYRRYPHFSALGKMIQDGRRAIDILQTIPQADPRRIGAMGHSLGAEETLFVAAFDERIQAAVASCGYAPFRVEKDPWRWARDAWFSYLPCLRADLRAGRLPAWDFDDAIRLVAPRGYFNYQTIGDEIFPEGAAAHAMTLSTRPLWNLHGVEDRLQSILEPGPHDISSQAKERIYIWLDRILQNK